MFNSVVLSLLQLLSDYYYFALFYEIGRFLTTHFLLFVSFSSAILHRQAQLTQTPRLAAHFGQHIHQLYHTKQPR